MEKPELLNEMLKRIEMEEENCEVFERSLPAEESRV